MAITDRYGLAAHDVVDVAAERFQDGMDRLLAYGPGVEECFAAALQADDRLAVGARGPGTRSRWPTATRRPRGPRPGGRARRWAAPPGASASTSRR